MSMTGKQKSIIILGSGALLLPLAALAHTMWLRNKLQQASQPGRAASANVSSAKKQLTTFNRAGRFGDPINMQILGTAGQIGASFAAAGWYRADEIDLVTSARISLDSLLNRKYSTAPVSNLYLFGRKEDLAFECPGTSVRQRDHVRLWDTNDKNGHDERPTWIGSATRDIKIELSKTNHLPTHGIAPDLDAERNLIVSELAQTGYLLKDTKRPGFGKETHGFNGGGDPYFTDGQVAVLTLADVWTLPLATQVRGPLLARITQWFSGFVRLWLPRAGQERAVREHQDTGLTPA